MDDILELGLIDLETWCLARGLKKFTATQVFQWLYQKKVTSFAEMTNVAKQARAVLSEHFIVGHLEITERYHSTQDGSTKFLMKLVDGRTVESVLMPQKGRLTLCVSSQVGCAMGCTFCKTAEMKLVRNLTTAEILGQLIGAQRESEQRISNVVMMGMGEPLHNYEAVIQAVNRMTDPKALQMSNRKVTVSTVGLAPEIERFGLDTRVKLALSLNATHEAGRLEVMPVTRKYPLDEVLAACKKYTTLTKHRVTLEYVMMAGVNDTPEDHKRLARIASVFPCKINLIPYNPFPGSPYQRPAESSIMDFHKYLADRHFQVNIRYSKGLDIMGACGQLATR